jgi:hypothetical protein
MKNKIKHKQWSTKTLYRIQTIGWRHESHNKPGVNFTEYKR